MMTLKCTPNSDSIRHGGQEAKLVASTVVFDFALTCLDRGANRVVWRSEINSEIIFTSWFEKLVFRRRDSMFKIGLKMVVCQWSKKILRTSAIKIHSTPISYITRILKPFSHSYEQFTCKSYESHIRIGSRSPVFCISELEKSSRDERLDLSVSLCLTS